MEKYTDKTEQEIRRELQQNETNSVLEINKLFGVLALAVFALPLLKIYMSRGKALPISETPQLAGLSKAIDSEVEKMLPGIFNVIRSNTLKSWKMGEGLTIASLNGKVPPNVMQSLLKAGTFAHRETAATEFIDRTINGMKLSDRVWRLKPALKIQIETTIQLAIHEGKSAIEVAGDLRQYLKNPDQLFRRVRDAAGKLQLSQAARSYHPGIGVYRSPIKNAHRLARNEISNAYRRADWHQMQDLPFVTGQRIQLSNSHAISDICDSLAGPYPKSFCWSGWHVQCRCHMIKEIISIEEFAKMEAGTFTPIQRTEYPYMFREWCFENRSRIKPNSGIDFIEENPAVLAIFENNK